MRGARAGPWDGFDVRAARRDHQAPMRPSVNRPHIGCESGRETRSPIRLGGAGQAGGPGGDCCGPIRVRVRDRAVTDGARSDYGEASASAGLRGVSGRVAEATRRHGALPELWCAVCSGAAGPGRASRRAPSTIEGRLEARARQGNRGARAGLSASSRAARAAAGRVERCAARRSRGARCPRIGAHRGAASARRRAGTDAGGLAVSGTGRLTELRRSRLVRGESA